MAHDQLRWIEILGCWATVLLMAACGGNGGGIRIDAVSIQTAQARLNPSSVNFGSVGLGDQRSESIILTNTGSGGLTVSAANVSGRNFSVSGLTLPVTLQAGQSTQFSAIFAPASSGTAIGAISVVTSASNSPLTVSLAGTGVNLHSVTLSWSPSASQNIAGYNVFRSAIPSGPYTQMNSALITITQYTDATVEAGATYYYVTTAQGNRGVQSPYSNQAEVTIPSP